MTHYAEDWERAQRNTQLELATVIDHKPSSSKQFYDNVMELDQYMDLLMNSPDPSRASSHKPLGVRLAKMLSQYDDSPSSQLWSDIQGLAREILR